MNRIDDYGRGVGTGIVDRDMGRWIRTIVGARHGRLGMSRRVLRGKISSSGKDST